MKKTTTLLLSLVCLSASAQFPSTTHVQQNVRQLIHQGGTDAKAAYAKAQLMGVAKLSSDCMEGASTGKISANYCLGVEAFALNVRELTPASEQNKIAVDWFEAKRMTDRVLAHCMVFLGVKNDTDCGWQLGAAKMIVPAADKPVAKPAAPAQPTAPASTMAKYKPSFDCSKAKGVAETAICTNAKTGQLDGLLSSVYRSRLTPAFDVDKAELRSSQRAWLVERNQCKDNECVAESILGRIQELCDIHLPGGRRSEDCNDLE